MTEIDIAITAGLLALVAYSLWVAYTWGRDDARSQATGDPMEPKRPSVPAGERRGGGDNRKRHGAALSDLPNPAGLHYPPAEMHPR